MLVFARYPGDGVVVETEAGPVTVTILSCKDGKVRVGIEAPPEIRVDRHEIHQLRHRQQVAAAWLDNAGSE